MPDRNRELRLVAGFVVGAFAFTWTFHGWLIAAGLTVATGRTLYRVGLLGPLVAALASTLLFESRAAAKAFLQHGVQLRGAVAVSACAILIPPALYTVATVSVGEGLPRLLRPALGIVGLLGAQAWVVICEEPGWRGFAWPRLRERLGPITAALSLGLIWATWHLPMFFVQDSRQQGSFAEFAMIVVSWTFVIGALLGRSSGSFLPALLFHWAANICAYVFELSARADGRASALWIAAGALAAIDMSRFRSAPRNAEHASGVSAN